MSEAIGVLDEIAVSACEQQGTYEAVPQISAPAVETRSQKMSRIMKEVRSKKYWNSLPKRIPYTKRQSLPSSAAAQIDDEIDRLSKEITVLRAAKALLNR